MDATLERETMAIRTLSELNCPKTKLLKKKTTFRRDFNVKLLLQREKRTPEEKKKGFMPQGTLMLRLGPQKHWFCLPLNLSPTQRAEGSGVVILFESFTLLLLCVCCVCVLQV